VVLSLVEFKDRGEGSEFLKDLPHLSDIMQQSETCLKGNLGRKGKLSLSENSYRVEDKIFKYPC
jgi:hypothetical protein